MTLSIWPAFCFCSDLGMAELPVALMLGQSPCSYKSVARLQQLGDAADRRGVHAQRALGREAQQVIRTARLEAGARQSFAAEWLHADDGADHAAIDIGVADARALQHAIDEALHAAVDAERQTVPARADPAERALELATLQHADVQHRAEDFCLRQSVEAGFECDRG